MVFLEDFNIFGNKLTSIPPEIGSMESLSILNLYANQIKTLPPEIANCTNLREINLKMNPINEGDKYKIRSYVNGADVKFTVQ